MIADMLICKKLDSRAIAPSCYSKKSVGFDLPSPCDLIIQAGTAELVPIGLRITLPPGTYGRIASRSCLTPVRIEVASGVIDPDYERGISVILRNHGTEDFRISRGDRIVQLICEGCVLPDLARITDDEDSTDSEALEAPIIRGKKGLGSSGIN